MKREAQEPLSIEDMDLGFEIPKDRIAQRPRQKRGTSRLLVYNRRDRSISHHVFSQLPGLIPPRSLLVLNDTRVIPSRLLGKKTTGGKLDLLLLRWLEENGAEGVAEVLARGSGRGIKPGTAFLHDRIEGRFLERTKKNSFIIKFWSPEGLDIVPLFSRLALMPLPPYVQRLPDSDDVSRYQTVFSSCNGSIAAPTAGLHFTVETLDNLKRRGTDIVYITLHVGEGTFKPIRSRFLHEHIMHEEPLAIDEASAARLARARAEGERILAVGTSCVRALEGIVYETKRIGPWSGTTGLFIRPGYRFQVVGAMITNFHTPRSTPLSLIMALVGIEETKRLYRAALEGDYLFFSYGDAMMVI